LRHLPPPDPTADPAYLRQIEAWRRQKDESLRRRDGWLALAALHWLPPGRSVLGSDPACDVVLPASAPPRLGALDRAGRVVKFLPEPGLIQAIAGAPAPAEPLQPDTAESPDRLVVGEITLALIERGDRLGLRVWDNARPERLRFAGRRWFPVNPEMCVQAEFEPSESGRTIAVPNQIGHLTEEPDLGCAIFRVHGERQRLRAVPADGGGLWFLFEDATNGTTTYRGGRFLVADAPRSGKVVLDFNRAYSPPCTFTPFATCPLPPEGNRLTVAVEAGERLPDDP
jgi:hypothetical protein